MTAGAAIRAGAHLRITEGPQAGHVVVVWSAAPDPGTYWAHFALGGAVVLIHVRTPRNQLPVVTLKVT